MPVHTSLRSATLLVLYGEGDRKSLVPPLCSRRRLLGWHANETKGFRQVPNKTTSTPPFTGRNRPSYADSVEISQRSEMMIIFSLRAGLLAVRLGHHRAERKKPETTHVYERVYNLSGAWILSENDAGPAVSVKQEI